MNKVSCYAFYGSLRMGMNNFEIYKQHLNYLTTETLRGFKLYALTNYPFAVKTEWAGDSIIVEIFTVTKPEIELEIHKMELNAGYYFDSVVVKGIKTGIYLFKDSSNRPIVPGGDWVNHFKKSVNTK